MENSRTRNTFYNALGGILVKFFNIFSAFAIRTVFIYTLGIEYAGISSVFTDILTVLSFAELGIGTAITYALYKPIAEGNTEKISQLMTVFKKVYSVIAISILGLGLLLVPFLDKIITNVPNVKENLTVIYCLYLLETSTSYLLIYKSTFLTAYQKDYLVSKIKVVFSVLKFIVVCLTLILTHSFIIYLVASIIIGILQNISIAIKAEKEFPLLKSKSNIPLSEEEKKTIINDVKALMLYKVSGTVLNGTDSIITSVILGTPVVGVLGNYNLISNQVSGFLMQIFGATAASIGNLAVTSSAEHQRNIFNRMLFLCFWFYCICATCLWVLFNPFMFIWQGSERLFDNITVTCLVIDFYIKGLMSPVTQFRTSNGLFVQGKYRPLIMAILNIGISIILAKRIGISGIILGTIISRALTQLWYDPLLIYRKVFSYPVRSYIIKYIGYFFVTAVSCCISKTLFNLYLSNCGFIGIIIGACLCCFVSCMLVVLVYSRKIEFRETLELIKRVIKRNL